MCGTMYILTAYNYWIERHAKFEIRYFFLNSFMMLRHSNIAGQVDRFINLKCPISTDIWYNVEEKCPVWQH